MKNQSILLIIQIFCLFSFIISTATVCASAGECQDPMVAATSEEKKVISDASGNVTLIDEDTQAEADSLAGTCPKGFHCSCPGCPLYSDIDEDKFCDLGEESEE
ncbi:MAG: hypothetical protein LUQ07_07280 [Methanospirillum sp.]|nr:hypothetical protein [Methanospirillum sp.]